MCGITGGVRLTEAVVREMNSTLAHRGPDGSGVLMKSAVSLGHTRLAIIDVSEAGAQPMQYIPGQGSLSRHALVHGESDAPYSLTFNGEIYNYLELRAELEAHGAVFNTVSDTEVILAAYATWGRECVKKFNGMWAFCIYDATTEELFLSRDRLGVKPLYYYKKDEAFVFASELKALLVSGVLGLNRLENINIEAVELYFSLGYIPAPHTIYQNVYQLQPAHNLVLKVSTGEIVTEAYWELPDFAPNENKSDLLAKGRALLTDATSLRMRADVPVGAFLSGGLDSTSVVATMRRDTSLDKLHTFSIGFEGVYDETPYIEIARTELGTVHHHQYFTQDDFRSQLTSFATMFDEPMSDHSGFPTELVSGMAREYVTVALSGDGGDEVFGGYASHRLGARLDFIKKLPRFIRQALSVLPTGRSGGKFSLRSFVLACRLSLGEPADFMAEASFGDTLRTAVAKEWLRHSFATAYTKSGDSFAEALRNFDVLYNTLPHKYLTKVDRASMHHSLEVRSPYLDYRFYEFTQTIPTKWKLNSRRGKIFMREMVAGDVPEAVINRPKQGFEPPVYEWLKSAEYELMLQETLNYLASISPEVASWYQKYETLHQVDSKHLFRLYAFGLWYKRWVEK